MFTEHASSRRADGCSGRSRILLIGGDEADLDIWRALLVREGFDVDQVRSGTVGLAFARQAIYDAVVLDLRLPDMTGTTVLKGLRSAGIATPVLIVTGAPSHESTAQAFRLGAADVLTKPVTAAEFITAVRRLLPCLPHNAPRAFRSSSLSRGGDALEEFVALLQKVEFLASTMSDGSMTEAGFSSSMTTLVGALARAVAHPRISVAAVLAGVQALRYAIAATRNHQLTQGVLEALLCFARAADTVDHTTSGMVAETLMRVESAIDAGRAVHESDIAAALGVHPAHVGRLLKLNTGSDFRCWRRIFRARRALLLLANSDEQLAQVAYAVGYPHASQLTRDVRMLFGVHPRWIRRCVRDFEQRAGPILDDDGKGLLPRKR